MARRLIVSVVILLIVSMVGMGLGCATPATPTPTPTVAPKATPGVTPTAVAPEIKPVKIRVASAYVSFDPVAKFWGHITTLLEERSGGKIKVDFYPGSQLFIQTDQYPALSNRAIEMVTETTNVLGSIRDPAWNISEFYTRYFKDYAAWQAFWEEPAGGGYFKSLMEKDGIKSFGTWFRGTKLPFAIANNKRLVKKVEDWKGLKLTGTPGKEWEGQAFGATIIPLPVADRPTAIQTGMVDGVTVSHSAMITGGYIKFVKYCTPSWDAGWQTGSYITLANLAWWNELSESNKGIITKALEESTTWMREVLIPEEDAPKLKTVTEAFGAGYYDMPKLDPAEYAKSNALHGKAVAERVKKVLPPEMYNLLETKYLRF